MIVNCRCILKAITLSAVLFLSLSTPARAENLLSLQVGAFSPGGDYPGTMEDGGDFGIFYTNTTRRLGFELGMHGYRTKMRGSADVGIVGAELLVTFQDPMASVQPYGGLGFGYYTVEADYDSGAKEKYQGSGIVAEVGVRGYIESLFIGLQIKGFTNKVDEAGILPGDSDHGGVSVDMTLGMIF